MATDKADVRPRSGFNKLVDEGLLATACDGVATADHLAPSPDPYHPPLSHYMFSSRFSPSLSNHDPSSAHARIISA